MMTAIRRLALLLGSLALLAACGAATDPPNDEETTVQPSATSSSGADPAPTGVVRTAVDDLAAILGIDPASVEVVSVEEVTWRDGSRGCAQKGMSYTQALIDGSRITLRAADQTFEYHSGGSQPPTRCARPTE